MEWTSGAFTLAMSWPHLGMDKWDICLVMSWPHLGVDKWDICKWHLGPTSEWISRMFTNLTRGCFSNESYHKSKISMEDPTDFKHKKRSKIAKRNWTIYLPLFMSYIDEYDIYVASLLLLLISLHCHLAWLYKMARNDNLSCRLSVTHYVLFCC